MKCSIVEDLNYSSFEILKDWNEQQDMWHVNRKWNEIMILSIINYDKLKWREINTNLKRDIHVSYNLKSKKKKLSIIRISRFHE